MLQKAKTSCLTPEDVRRLRLEPFIEGHSLDIQPNWAGFKIPYFTPDGKVDSAFYRFRFLQQKPSKGWGSIADAPAKPRRYSQPKGSSCGVYLPPLLSTKWSAIATDPSVKIVITEGELKAAAGCKHGIATIGLGGVYNWRSAKELQELIPALEMFEWNGRVVVICFDSDAATNVMVRLAASQLASTLAKRGALVYWMSLPPTAEGGKQGMDDFLFTQGEAEFFPLMKDATELGPGVDMHTMNSEAAIIRSTGEVVELHTGHVYTATQFTETIYKPRTFMSQEGAKGASVMKSTAKEWLAWPLRTEVTRLEYAPDCPAIITEDGAYNTWSAQPWACTPKNRKGSTVQPWERLFKHVFGSLSLEHQLWAKQWLAYPLQHPGTKLATAMLVWGRQQGTGKTLIGETMGSIYGKNFGTVNNALLAGSFNEWAVDKQFIVGDEISLGDKRGIANSLKDMITRRTVRVNIKNRKTYSIRDCINYFFTSNHEDAIYMEAHDRRIFVVHADVQPLEISFYSDYQRWLQEGGAERLFYYFLHEVDCSTFDPQGRAPVTAAKLEMAASGRGDAEDWCVQLVTRTDEVLPPAKFPYDLYRTQDLLALYDPDGKLNIKAIGMGKALGAAGVYKVAGGNNSALVEGVRTRFWAVRNAEKYRRMGPAEAKRAYEAERPLLNKVGQNSKFSGKPN